MLSPARALLRERVASVQSAGRADGRHEPPTAPSWRSHLDRLLPGEIGALARLFPVLKRVDAIAQAMEKNPVHISNVAELRRRAFHAFASLLKAISAERPVVICLDDLHWGDSDSAALFQHLFSRRSVPPVAIVAAYRAGGTSSRSSSGSGGLHVAAASCPVRVTSITVGPFGFALGRSTGPVTPGS